MFVTDIIPETNVVVLGEIDDLMRNGITVGQVNTMKYEQIPDGLELITQVRYNDSGTLSQINNIHPNINVEFYANVKGIAPGQSAVFYEGDDVVGGGIILSSNSFN